MNEQKVKKQSQNGGFLSAISGLIPTIAKFIPKIIAPLATGALTSVGDVAMKKIMSRGIINVSPEKKNDLIDSSKLTKSQINKLLNSPCQCQLNLTKKQSQNGGFLGLPASLGIPIISLIGSLMGKGLQIRTRTSNKTKGSGIQIRTRTPGAGLQIDSIPGSY